MLQAAQGCPIDRLNMPASGTIFPATEVELPSAQINEKSAAGSSCDRGAIVLQAGSARTIMQNSHFIKDTPLSCYTRAPNSGRRADSTGPWPWSRFAFHPESVPQSDKSGFLCYAGKYLDVYQFPDGKIEIRAAGVKVPYSTYDKLGAIDQGAIVENKRLGHALRISSLVQAERDNHYYAGPSTAHRVNGKHVPRKKVSGTKTQRELNQKDVEKALEVRT